MSILLLIDNVTRVPKIDRLENCELPFGKLALRTSHSSSNIENYYCICEDSEFLLMRLEGNLRNFFFVFRKMEISIHEIYDLRCSFVSHLLIYGVERSDKELRKSIGE